jgi:hypothetical protein
LVISSFLWSLISLTNSDRREHHRQLHARERDDAVRDRRSVARGHHHRAGTTRSELTAAL